MNNVDCVCPIYFLSFNMSYYTMQIPKSCISDNRLQTKRLQRWYEMINKEIKQVCTNTVIY